MNRRLGAPLLAMFRKTGFAIIRSDAPVRAFHTDHYLRHNARRLEHLASLQIPVAGRSVLEVGAGIGDHSSYYIDRGCRITITETREENLSVLRRRFPAADVQRLDMEAPLPVSESPFEVIHCYGLLYHLSSPNQALEFISRSTSEMLLLETCVSFGDALEVHPVSERQTDPTQANSGTGCRPTRAWIFNELQRLFEHVYVPKTQPNHEEFPLNWLAPEKHTAGLQRAIFVASRQPLDNPRLNPGLLDHQVRHV
jgi:SAM-dependent methyltransferase